MVQKDKMVRMISGFRCAVSERKRRRIAFALAFGGAMLERLGDPPADRGQAAVWRSNYRDEFDSQQSFCERSAVLVRQRRT